MLAVLTRLGAFAGRYFALLVIAAGVVAMVVPAVFTPFAPHIPLLLGVVMFGMGLTLQPPDFAQVMRRPGAMLLGIALQYTVMPGLGYLLGAIFGFGPELAVGMILVGSAPGGTASNVIVYLARGDVALSVTMTSASTLLAPLMTPLLVLWLAGEILPVAFTDMASDIVQIVLLPVLGGLVLRRIIPRVIERILGVLPLVSVTAVVVIVAAIFAGNVDEVLALGPLLALAVVLHNVGGLGLGYAVARLARADVKACRAISIEVGMQNSGLAVALATSHFSALAALPGALFSVWHNVSGALLATWWARSSPEPQSASGENSPPRVE